ncbi:alpha/beta fold hydrolase [Amycolatopsis circi]|uniref:alpha/beta fold hydrolase n=1 Tax=Amycolatopsis circi TaxID=871959 RepID=UPI000E284A9F|nr:alpha/beta fold hydrolase [Amycolatopsis circi]
MPELSHDATLRELRTDRGVLRYHEAGDGPPLVLLHGSGPGVTGWQNFRANLPSFAAHFRCLILEFPGFGVSDPVAEPPMPAAERAVLDLLDGLDIAAADLVGNSMGGFVATRTAIAHPDRVRRLVTVGGMGTNIFSPAPGEGINLLTEFVEDPTRERLVQWLNSMVFDRGLITEELIEERWRLATAADSLASAKKMYGKGVLQAQAAAAFDVTPLWATLRKIRARTLVTWGRDDRVSPLDMALIPMRTIPHAELHILPNCGHWTMIEQKDAWESAVLAFLLRKDGD